MRDVIAHTRCVLDAAVDGIISADERGIIESANAAVTRMFGYSADELIGRNLTLLMPAPYAAEHDGYIERYLRSGEPRIIGIGREVAGRRRDGSTFPLELAVAEARIGARRLFTGILRDISDRRAAEESVRQLGEILEESVNEIYVFDAQSLRFTRINRGARENLGYSQHELEQMTPLDIKPEMTRERFDALLAPLRRGEQSRAHFRTPHRRKDGSTYRADVHLHYHEDPSASRFVALVLDVSQQEALETQLLQAQKMEAIGQLAGGIAHDFNNLLTSIVGSSELLAARMNREDRSLRAVRRIQAAAERGAALTQKLLTFGRRQISQPEILDINESVAQMADLASRLIGEDVDVTLDLEADAYPVRADRTQLDQVLLNLIVNAGDAMPSGGRLRIETRNVSVSPFEATRLGTSQGPALQLSVIDTGTGMSDETLERVFEPFFTTKETGKGTGLGLSTVYGIAKQSGWGVDVQSTLAQGSTFSIYIPRAADDAGAKPEKGQPARRVHASGSTILLVEDDELLREMASEALESDRHRVLAAETPERAIELANKHGGEIDLVVADVVMPGMSGIELVAYLRGPNPGLRVLLISGYADEALATRGALPAELPYLAKPFGTETFIQRVRDVLAARETQT
jgi:PAS domain S-box-containing protein